MSDEPANDRLDEETIASLTAALDEVRDEMTGIRRVVDEIQNDVEWVARNRHADEWRPIQPLTSMPLDPLATDWAQRVNRFTAADIKRAQRPIDQIDAADAVPHTPAAQEEDGERLVFCCDSPALIWIGDPDFPGVACANCGYVVAESGSVVMSPAPDVHGCELPPEPVGPAQQELF